MRDYLIHPALLLNSKRTATLTMAAMQTLHGIHRELSIVIRGYGVACKRKIVIFIYESDIYSRRTGLTMVTIDTGALNCVCREACDNRIISFIVGCGEKLKQSIKMLHSLNTGNCRKHTRAVNSVLQTLVMCKSHSER